MAGRKGKQKVQKVTEEHVSLLQYLSAEEHEDNAQMLIKRSLNEDIHIRCKAAAGLADYLQDGEYGAGLDPDDMDPHPAAVLAEAIRGKRPDRSIIIIAVRALAVMGSAAAKHAGGALAHLLTHGDTEVRWEVSRALGFLGSRAAKASAVALGRMAVEDTSDVCRREAARSIVQMGPKAKGAAVLLAKAIAADDDVDVRNEALRALKAIGPGAAGVAGEVARVCLGSSMEQRRLAVEALHEMGEDASDAASSTLALLLRPGNVTVDNVKRHSTTRIGGDVKLRRLAVQALGAMGSETVEKHVVAISRALGDADQQVRELALEVLRDADTPLCTKAMGGPMMLFEDPNPMAPSPPESPTAGADLAAGSALQALEFLEDTEGALSPEEEEEAEQKRLEEEVQRRQREMEQEAVRQRELEQEEAVERRRLEEEEEARQAAEAKAAEEELTHRRQAEEEEARRKDEEDAAQEAADLARLQEEMEEAREKEFGSDSLALPQSDVHATLQELGICNGKRSASKTACTPQITEADFARFLELVGLSKEDAPEVLVAARAARNMPLPDFWTEGVDKEYGLAYYYNVQSDENTWDHPLIPTYREVLAFIKNLVAEALQPKALADRMQVALNEAHQKYLQELEHWQGPIVRPGEVEGQPFFFNTQTGESEWRDPSERLQHDVKMRFDLLMGFLMAEEEKHMESLPDEDGSAFSATQSMTISNDLMKSLTGLASSLVSMTSVIRGSMRRQSVTIEDCENIPAPRLASPHDRSDHLMVPPTTSPHKRSGHLMIPPPRSNS